MTGSQIVDLENVCGHGLVLRDQQERMTVITQVEKLLHKDRVCMDALPAAVAAAQVLVTAKKDDVVVAADEFQHTAGLRVEPGGFHVYVLSVPFIPEAVAALDRSARFISWILTQG